MTKQSPSIGGTDLPEPADWLAELDARTGALHRNLSQAVKAIAEVEGLIADQRLLGPAAPASLSDAGRIIMRAAVAYIDACRAADTAMMTRTFGLLRRAVATWRVAGGGEQ